ncbi:MAG: ATP-binding protein [Thermodesulfobacteriota bacterium]|nr:ATP-binding protein [Thermodesulfobacteriota bacterium]
MKDHAKQEEDLTPRLRWLMFLRVVIVTFILGVAGFIHLKGNKISSDLPVFSVIIFSYILSLLYLFFLNSIKNLKLNIYIQAFGDVSLISTLIYLTGGITSIYSVLYSLVIIYSSLFITRRGGLIVASVSGIFYGLLLDLEYYDVIHPLYAIPWGYDFSAGYVLSRIFVHIASFYIIALLVNFVVEQEKRSRSLLEEKKSEFHQLDLLYKNIIRSVNTGIMTTDLDGNIRLLNRAGEQIIGLSFLDVEGKPIGVIFNGFSDILYKIRNKEKGKDTVKRGETTITAKQKKIMLGFSVSPLIGSKGNRIGQLIVFQDMTSAKEMEKEIEKSRRLALIGEMSAGLAHEVRNPLASLKGSIQILKNTLYLDETNKKLMEIVLRGSAQLENLVKDFLLLARPGPGLKDREEIDVNDVMDSVIESLRYGPAWHEQITVEKEPCPGAVVYGNRTEVNQILSNLVLNAVQSMPEGGTLTIQMKLRLPENGNGSLDVRISDTGCGIERDDIAKVFNPFFSTKEGGTGLGLTITQRLIENHGGKIRIESRPKKGIICRLLLPLNKKAEVD